MVTVRTKTGKKKTYKNYEAGTPLYSGGYVNLIHKSTGNKKRVKQ